MMRPVMQHSLAAGLCLTLAACDRPAPMAAAPTAVATAPPAAAADAGPPREAPLPAALLQVIESEGEPRTASFAAFVAAYDWRCAKERPRDPDLQQPLSTWGCPRMEYDGCGNGEHIPHHFQRLEGDGAKRRALYVKDGGGDRFYMAITLVDDGGVWKSDGVACAPAADVVALCSAHERYGSVDPEVVRRSWRGGTDTPLDEVLAQPKHKRRERLALIATVNGVGACPWVDAWK